MSTGRVNNYLADTIEIDSESDTINKRFKLYFIYKSNAKKLITQKLFNHARTTLERCVDLGLTAIKQYEDTPIAERNGAYTLITSKLACDLPDTYINLGLVCSEIGNNQSQLDLDYPLAITTTLYAVNCFEKAYAFSLDMNHPESDNIYMANAYCHSEALQKLANYYEHVRINNIFPNGLLALMDQIYYEELCVQKLEFAHISNIKAMMIREKTLAKNKLAQLKTLLPLITIKQELQDNYLNTAVNHRDQGLIHANLCEHEDAIKQFLLSIQLQSDARKSISTKTYSLHHERFHSQLTSALGGLHSAIGFSYECLGDEEKEPTAKKEKYALSMDHYTVAISEMERIPERNQNYSYENILTAYQNELTRCAEKLMSLPSASSTPEPKVEDITANTYNRRKSTHSYLLLNSKTPKPIESNDDIIKSFIPGTPVPFI